MRRPSMLKATAVTVSPWPTMRPGLSPEVASQTRMVLSKPAETSAAVGSEADGDHAPYALQERSVSPRRASRRRTL